MNLAQFLGALDLGLIYGLVALGVFISFRVLQFPDLTVDGSFPLGAATAAALLAQGFNPLIATMAAVLAGAFAGFVTAWLSTHLRVFNLLAGILTMTALYSINLRIMGGRPNLAVLQSGPSGVAIAGIALVFGLFTYWFLTTQIGLAVRAVGQNARMSRAIGINDSRMIWLGLSLSNALVALAGAVFAQRNGFADVGMGLGTIIAGLAAVIIGEVLLPTRKILLSVIAVIVGSIFYRLVIAGALNLGALGLEPSDLNLITAALVAIAMLVLSRKSK